MKKISEGNKGKEVSEETREKLRQHNLGKKHSEESRQKMSESHKGKDTWNKGITGKIHQYDMDMNLVQVWDNLEDIKNAGFIKPNVVTVCKGRRKSHKGFIWKYEKDI